MNARIVIVSAIALVSACAHFGAAESDCAKDLLATGYLADFRQPSKSANEYCAERTPEQIASAKALMAGKYHENFERAMKDVVKYTPTQLECAKKEFDAEKPAGFRVSQACQETVLAPTAPVVEAAVDGSLYGVMKADGKFTKYLAAVEAAGMTDTLKAGGPWTVFAPTDDAVAANPAVFDTAMEKQERVKDLLKLSLVNGKHMTSELKPTPKGKKGMGVDNKWGTSNGGSISLVQREGVITINGRNKVVTADIPASNGVINALDGFVVP